MLTSRAPAYCDCARAEQEAQVNKTFEVDYYLAAVDIDSAALRVVHPRLTGKPIMALEVASGQ